MSNKIASIHSKPKIFFFGVSGKLLEMLEKTGFVETLGKDCFFPTIDACLDRAQSFL